MNKRQRKKMLKKRLHSLKLVNAILFSIETKLDNLLNGIKNGQKK